MKITCVSDLHGHLPQLDGGDLLIVAGDLTARDTPTQNKMFFDWLIAQQYRCKIVIAGNHDGLLEKSVKPGNLSRMLGMKDDGGLHYHYLCDSGTEFERLKIWGSPWTKTFEGMNPKCKAFTVDTEEELAEKWALIPDDIDILITHCPPYLIHDYCGKHVGSKSLIEIIRKRNFSLHVFGHIQECGGKIKEIPNIKFVNASHVNERYQPVNKPISIKYQGFTR